MNLKNLPPVFVPAAHRAEIEKLSKAALMDLVWDFAQRCAAADSSDTEKIMAEVRTSAEIVTTHREQERGNYDSRKGIYR